MLWNLKEAADKALACQVGNGVVLTETFKVRAFVLERTIENPADELIAVSYTCAYKFCKRFPLLIHLLRLSLLRLSINLALTRV
jgi:hypothetical protein